MVITNPADRRRLFHSAHPSATTLQHSLAVASHPTQRNGPFAKATYAEESTRPTTTRHYPSLVGWLVLYTLHHHASLFAYAFCFALLRLAAAAAGGAYVYIGRRDNVYFRVLHTTARTVRSTVL